MASEKRVFYSWQSDRPASLTRSLIETALEWAATKISKDVTLSSSVAIDQDTRGVSGTPDIPSTIFDKIAKSDVFVADITIVTNAIESRPSPNPNVLVELGYAIRALGWERVLLIMNTSYGRPEALPFDLRAHRVITFNADVGGEKAARKFLEQACMDGLTSLFKTGIASQTGVMISPESPFDSALLALNNAAPDRFAKARRYVRDLMTTLVAIAPDLDGREFRDEALVEALANAREPLADFFRIATRAAELGDQRVIRELRTALEPLAERLNNPVGFAGTWYEHKFDFWTFITHEILVGLVAVLLRENDIGGAADVAKSPIIVPNLAGQHGRLKFSDLCNPVRTLHARSQRLDQRFVSPQGNMLKELYSTPPLSDVIGFDEFQAGDAFIYLVSEIPHLNRLEYPDWLAHSLIYSGKVPRFLTDALRKDAASTLATVLGAGSIDELRKRLAERLPTLNRMHGPIAMARSAHPITRFDARTIGTY